MRCRWWFALTLATALPLPAQVFQVQGSGSSLFDGAGGLVNVWGPGYEASLGIGWLDGLRIGASARRLVGGRDTLRLGNDLLPLQLDTDVFATGATLFAQGVSLQRRRGRTQSWLFAGTSATVLAAPGGGVQRPMHAMAYARVRHDLTRALAFTGHAVATDRQSAFGSLAWSPDRRLRSSATVGLGNNAPYGALAFDLNLPSLEVKSSLVGMGRRFRRSAAPMPMQTEMERENAVVVWKPRDGWSLGAGRQHFRQDGTFATIAPNAALSQLFGAARVGRTSVSGGWMHSAAGRQTNVSTYLNARQGVGDRLEGELYLLRVWQPTESRSVTPVLLLRERITSQLSLLQTITRESGRTSVNFGGAIATGLTTLSLDYQVVHSPYLVTQPFVQTMGVSARLHVRGVSLSFGSFVTPDGRVHYTAQGNRFLYRGAAGAGASSGGAGALRVRGYLASGRVVDDTGAPVDGAALLIGGETIYTDSRGRFFVRRPSRDPVALQVVTADFLMPGAWEVVSAPAQLVPAPDDRAVPVTIVVRRTDR